MWGTLSEMDGPPPTPDEETVGEHTEQAKGESNNHEKLKEELVGKLSAMYSASKENLAKFPEKTKESAAKLTAATKEGAAKLTAVTKENAAKLTLVTKENAAKLTAATQENAAKLTAVTKQNAAKLSNATKENAAKWSTATKENAAKLAEKIMAFIIMLVSAVKSLSSKAKDRLATLAALPSVTQAGAEAGALLDSIKASIAKFVAWFVSLLAKWHGEVVGGAVALVAVTIAGLATISPHPGTSLIAVVASIFACATVREVVPGLRVRTDALIAPIAVPLAARLEGTMSSVAAGEAAFYASLTRYLGFPTLALSMLLLLFMRPIATRLRTAVSHAPLSTKDGGGKGGGHGGGGGSVRMLAGLIAGALALGRMSAGLGAGTAQITVPSVSLPATPTPRWKAPSWIEARPRMKLPFGCVAPPRLGKGLGGLQKVLKRAAAREAGRGRHDAA